MSHGYVPVQWNKQKKWYDLAIWAGIIVYIALFIIISSSLFSGDEALSFEILLIRALATCAFLMLTMILSVGPLARLDERFLPLLYNRRHFGVSMCIIALAHAVLATIWYHGFGVENPFLSIFFIPDIHSLSDIPFQPFGFFALLIILLMAATSHDFWNANLGAPFWKAIHMGVYLAYALLVVHIALGALQEPNTGFLPPILYGSVIIVGGLHLMAAFKSAPMDKGIPFREWVDIGSWRNIPNDRARVVTIGKDERVAIFRYEENKLAAVSNVCQHQNGPLGEGKVINGCITCPWHGFQYRPEDGRSPAPFTEKIETYRLRLEGDRVLLDPKALPKGTARPVLTIAKDQQNTREAARG
ncbi:MAG: sulfoxide reductase heme-binding subunit YedZ [Cellvibrionaceae bacterium]|jgi:sulfoxide reductase heme-binding subunit YedZ